MGESQRLGIETFLLFTKPELSHISSSAVKEIQKDQGLIQDYVSPYVKQCLEKKLSKQYIVGLTGEIGREELCCRTSSATIKKRQDFCS